MLGAEGRQGQRWIAPATPKVGGQARKAEVGHVLKSLVASVQRNGLTSGALMGIEPVPAILSSNGWRLPTLDAIAYASVALPGARH